MSHNEHDQLFKKLLTENLPAFISLFLTDIAAQVDFSSLKFLDKELFTALAISDKRESDLVVQAKTIDKKPINFIFLIEIEDKEGRTRKKQSCPNACSLTTACYALNTVFPFILSCYTCSRQRKACTCTRTRTKYSEIRWPSCISRQ